MATFSDLDSVPSASEEMRGWLWKGLIVASLLHVGLFIWFDRVDYLSIVEEQVTPETPVITMKVERIEIDPAMFNGEVLEGDDSPPTTPNPVQTKIEIPADKLAFERELNEVRASPAAVEIDPTLLEDKPRDLADSLSDSISKIEDRTNRMLEKDLQSMSDQLIVDRPKTNARKLMDTPGYPSAKAPRVGMATNLRAESAGEAAGPTIGPPGFSDLDELLSNAGPMSRPMAQIMMPADLLFEYDSFDLAAGAVPSLEKLAIIIRRNPAATIAIEGHTDAFGTDEYNQRLSEQRAMAVKNWLVYSMGIEPSRIVTHGFGRRRLLVPANGTIDEQQMNRRVEIVIRQPRKP